MNVVDRRVPHDQRTDTMPLADITNTHLNKQRTSETDTDKPSHDFFSFIYSMFETKTSKQRKSRGTVVEHKRPVWKERSLRDFERLYSLHGKLLGQGTYGSVYVVHRTPVNAGSPPKAVWRDFPGTMAARMSTDMVAVKIVEQRALVDPHNGRDFVDDSGSTGEVYALRVLLQTYGEEACNGLCPVLIDYCAVNANTVEPDYTLASSESSCDTTPSAPSSVIQYLFERASDALLIQPPLHVIVMSHEAGMCVYDYVVAFVQKQHVNRVKEEQRRSAGMKPHITPPFITSLDVAVLLAQTLESLALVHRADLVHGDMSTSNVQVLSSTGLPVLIDFGFACSTRQETGAHADDAWTGGAVPQLPLVYCRERAVIDDAKKCSSITHSTVRAILQATDISQVTRSFNELIQETRQNIRMFGAGLRWTYNVQQKLDKFMELTSSDVIRRKMDALACSRALCVAIDMDMDALNAENNQ